MTRADLIARLMDGWTVQDRRKNASGN